MILARREGLNDFRLQVDEASAVSILVAMGLGHHYERTCGVMNAVNEHLTGPGFWAEFDRLAEVAGSPKEMADAAREEFREALIRETGHADGVTVPVTPALDQGGIEMHLTSEQFYLMVEGSKKVAFDLGGAGRIDLLSLANYDELLTDKDMRFIMAEIGARNPIPGIQN